MEINGYFEDEELLKEIKIIMAIKLPNKNYIFKWKQGNTTNVTD